VSESLRDSQSSVANHSRNQRRELGLLSICQAIVWIACLALLLYGGGAVSAEDGPGAQLQSLDEQVQEIKSDVLSIAAELNRLEEKLLFPSDTQVAVFVSLADGEKPEVDSVQIQIDGELVAHHIYSFKELEALQKGGVQRIYTGNLPTGEHRLDVSVTGKLSGGREWSQTETFNIEKSVEPKLVGIELASNEIGQAQIGMGNE